ncbi:MAG: chitobiase/beta-hexosaminidase C-terminal domain-containing protein [Prevotella sp.]|nr:chitobiase/beta-hexosaminidase C-terminal domain-containing protein [Prevotella sp.]
MKKSLRLIACSLLMMAGSGSIHAQGWPADYPGVMLQAFYWDSYSQSAWTKLTAQSDALARTFNLVWIPQSGYCGGTSMGYDDLYWFNNYNSSFGNEQELRTLISTFKEKGIGTIADVVINHRKNVSNWVDFPRETYKGETYEMVSTDICSDDDGGETKAWADKNGYSLSANKDSGEGWGGMRDLDHNSENVQKCVKAYLDFLLNDLGYTGFRYDMVKGYKASFTAQYNSEAKPQFSVGECWDSSNTIANWIDGTKVGDVPQSAAFDFQFKYVCANAFNNGVYSNLGLKNPWGDMPLNSSSFRSGAYRQYAVTFVENHDTEVRPDGSSNGPLEKDTLAANAYLLAMPGTPCIFMKHWMAYPHEIASMVDVRRAAGVVNTSSYTNMRSSKDYYANLIKTNNENRMMVIVGDVDGFIPSAAQYTQVLEGYHYRYYMANSLETAWADKASGMYDEPFSVRLAAVTNSQGAQLVYTLDGSTPTASSAKAENGATVSIESDCTLTVGLLVDGAVKGIVSRDYTFNNFVKTKITVYVDPTPVEWSSVNFCTWGGDDSHSPSKGWPGDAAEGRTEIDGINWFYRTYTINSDDDLVNFVFSTGSGSPQTVDINGVKSTKFFEISTEKDGEKFLVNDVTPIHNGINDIFMNYADKAGGVVYDLQGRRMNADQLPRGIYVTGGKKFVIK